MYRSFIRIRIKFYGPATLVDTVPVSKTTITVLDCLSWEYVGLYLGPGGGGPHPVTDLHDQAPVLLLLVLVRNLVMTQNKKQTEKYSLRKWFGSVFVLYLSVPILLRLIRICLIRIRVRFKQIRIRFIRNPNCFIFTRIRFLRLRNKPKIWKNGSGSGSSRLLYPA